MSQLDLSVIDRAIALLEAGPLVVFDAVADERHEYFYSCYALRLAQDKSVFYRDERDDPYLKAYIAFSGEKFGVGVQPEDHLALDGNHKDYFELVPKWWNVRHKPYTEERVAHLKEFRQYVSEA